MSETGRPEPGLYSVESVSSVPIERSIVVEPPPVEMPPPSRRRYGRWFAWLILAFFGAALAYDAVLFLMSLFAVSTIAGIAASDPFVRHRMAHRMARRIASTTQPPAAQAIAVDPGRTA
jgi:hypothetical protein